MGQRLNIEIWNKGKVLANAYYHWSAFTVDALNLISKILQKVDCINCNDGVLKAVWLLQETGAGLPDDEKKSRKAKDFSQLTGFKGRDYGIIGITDKGISETRHWEEERVTIYLDEHRIDYDVIYRERKWEYDKEAKEWDYPEFDKLPLIEWNLRDIKFNDFPLFKQCLEEMDKNNEYRFRNTVEPWIVYTMIA
jgi:hypothetical protein